MALYDKRRVKLRDGDAAPTYVGTRDDAEGDPAPQHIPLVLGLPVSSGNPMPTADAGLGTDGAAPPSIPGTGVRGWLRGIFEKIEAVRALLAGSLTVTGPLTNAQLRGAAVDVSGSTVGVSGSVAVSGPLTDTQLRATAVPVSGPLTDTQLRATPLATLPKGSTGTNASANQPTNVSVLTGAGMVLLGTALAANASRGAVVIQNQSAGDIVVVGDPGASDSDIWTYLLKGVGAGAQGAELPPELGRFRGRIRVYGATGARVSIVEV